MPKRSHTIKPPRSVRGTSLIEIMVAVVVLSTGLLGMVALQAKALRNNQSSLERSQAVVLMTSITDRMRSNRVAATNGDYNLAMGVVPGAGATLAATDLQAWYAELQAALGAGAAGSVACGADGLGGVLCTVGVRWNDSRGTLGLGEYNFQTVTRI